MTIKELTPAEFKILLDEYFAPPVKRSKMSETQIKDLAIRLNRKINVPLVSETGEEKIIIKIVIKVDRFLYDNLPNEFYDLLRSTDKGIDDVEAKRLVKSLASLANKKIDIPYVPEQVEYFSIRFIIGILVNAARKNWNLIKSNERMNEMKIPSVSEPLSLVLEEIIIKDY